MPPIEATRPTGSGSAPMNRWAASCLGAVLCLAVLAGLVGTTAVFKVADDGQQALVAANAAKPQGVVSATARVDTAVVAGWHAPRLLGSPFRLTPNVSQLLLAALAGFLGAAIQAGMALAIRRGYRSLDEGFELWYVFGPLAGAGVGLLFFAAVRGGLLLTGGSNGASLNLFGVLAVSGVVGLFARRAVLKLGAVLGEFAPPKGDKPAEESTTVGKS